MATIPTWRPSGFPAPIFPDATGDLGRVVLHAVMVLVEAAVLF